MPRSYFISDLHLTPRRPRVTAAFSAFLEQNSDCDALYILGDLFDAWIGDDDDSALAQQIRELLKSFTDGGPALYLMRGNRDFLLETRFCNAVGATLLDDPTTIEIGGQPTLLMHGDSLCIDDRDYQAFRQTVQRRAWREEVLARSLADRRELARELREMSGELKSNKTADIMDASAAEVARVMSEHRVKHLIHGHTHRPARHEEPEGIRWVLGDWVDEAWVLETTDANFNLYKISIN